MPEFKRGESKTAKVTMRNLKPVAFDCLASLRIGYYPVCKSDVSFRLEAGEEKVVTFLIVMPTTGGVYPVLIIFMSDGKYTATYRATEDVTIAEHPKFAVGDIIESNYPVIIGFQEGWIPIWDIVQAEITGYIPPTAEFYRGFYTIKCISPPLVAGQVYTRDAWDIDDVWHKVG